MAPRDNTANARTIARQLIRFPRADAKIRDVLNGKLTVDAWLAGMSTSVDDAWKMIDNADLWGGLWMRFAQPALARHNYPFPAELWGAVHERMAAALREDARAAFELGARAALTDVALQLEALRDGDEHALDAVLGRLAAAPLDAKRVTDAMVDTPQMDAALAAMLASPPPAPQAPPPKATSPKPDLLGALGRVAGLFSALKSVASSLKTPPAAPPPAVLTRHAAAVVALRIDGTDVLSRDASGVTLRTPLAGGSSQPAAFLPETPPDFDRWPPTPGPVRGWVRLTGDVLAVVGQHDSGGGWFAQGGPGDTWAHLDDDDEETELLCAAVHPDGVAVGGADGSIRLYEPELATGLDLDAPVRSLVADGSSLLAGLDDGRVVRVAFG